MPKQIAIIGCGEIAARHASALQKRGVLLSFQSRSKNRAKSYAKKFGGQKIFEHYSDVLTDPSIEAVVLCTPPDLHAEAVIAALESKKPILVEKPLCISAKELESIASKIQPSSFLMVAENYDYKPSLYKIKKWIDAGWIGAVREIECYKQFEQKSSGWKENFGALLEGGIHFIAWISALLNDAEVANVRARFLGLSEKNRAPERNSVTEILYTNGVKATLHYAWNVPHWAKGLFQHSKIIGEKGEILFESNGIYGLLKGSGRFKIFFGFKDLMGYSAMIDDFLFCLEHRLQKPVSDFSKAKKDLEIVFSAYAQL